MTTTDVLTKKPAARRKTTRAIRGNSKPKAGPVKFLATLTAEITATDHVIAQKLSSEWKKFISKFVMGMTDAKNRKASISTRSFKVQVQVQSGRLKSHASRRKVAQRAGR